MALTISSPGHAEMTAAADAMTFSTHIRVSRLVVVANGTAGVFEILDAAGGSRIAYYDSGAVTDVQATIMEKSRPKGIYVNAIPTSGVVHVYYD